MYRSRRSAIRPASDEGVFGRSACAGSVGSAALSVAMKARTQSRKMLGALVLCMLTFACQQDMARQPRYRPLQYSEVFADHRSARPLVEHTVAREHLRDDAHLYTGKEGEEYVTTFPFEITESVLERGRQRY